MNQRTFGGSGARISEVGLGCWQFGGDWGAVSDEQALTTLNAAADAGVTFFDTADVYGLGRSETVIGQFLRNRKSDFFVATKLGRFPQPGWPANFSLATFRKHTEASLKRLGVESLDLTQLHCIPPELMKSGECFDWLGTLKQEGKIKHFGASVESMDEAITCLRHPGLASLQIIFNIFRQKPIDALFEQAKRKGVAIIVRLPLASGLLSGKMSKQTHFAPQDHRNYNRNGESFNVGETFAGLPFEKGVELADELKPMVPHGMTMAQMALRWCLDYPEVSVIIPGAKDPAQARANAATSDLPPLSDAIHRDLHHWYEQSVRDHIRGPY